VAGHSGQFTPVRICLTETLQQCHMWCGNLAFQLISWKGHGHGYCDSEVSVNEIDFQNCGTVLKSYVIPGDLGKPVNVTLRMSGKPEVEFDGLITLDTTGQCSMA